MKYCFLRKRDWRIVRRLNISEKHSWSTVGVEHSKLSPLDARKVVKQFDADIERIARYVIRNATIAISVVEKT